MAETLQILCERNI